MSGPPTLRCAIYTRKSSEDGLEQEFNSLDAQHEACAAYIASQRHEGWKLVPNRYDDGGLSGGTLERPALQRLLADVETGRIDRIVVYKIDRLTRSLSDFSKIVDQLEDAGCSFVSITQSFNTATSMGRLTLNMLLSFAQFEREVTAERIRDKIAASKKKGLWMGGNVPIGYDRHPDPNTRVLVVNQGEAETVNKLYRLYDVHGCLRQVTTEAARLNLRSKRRIFASGREQGGNLFTRGQIYYLLRNPTYLGLTRHKDRTWPGQHPAIVDETLWQRVQEKLAATSARPRGRAGATARNGDPAAASPLTGKLRDEIGDLLTPTHTQRHGRRLRYYISNRLISGGPDPTGWRLPAPGFETAVAKIVTEHLQRCADRHEILSETDIRESDALTSKIADLCKTLRTGSSTDLSELILSGQLERNSIRIKLNGRVLAQRLEISQADLASNVLNITAPITLRRRGIEMKLIAGKFEPRPDPTLIRTLARAHHWIRALQSGTPLTELALKEKVSPSYLRTRAQLAFLSPSIQQAILDGRQPPHLTVKSIISAPVPLDWDRQAHRYGFAAPDLHL